MRKKEKGSPASSFGKIKTEMGSPASSFAEKKKEKGSPACSFAKEKETKELAHRHQVLESITAVLVPDFPALFLRAARTDSSKSHQRILLYLTHRHQVLEYHRLVGGVPPVAVLQRVRQRLLRLRLRPRKGQPASRSILVNHQRRSSSFDEAS